MAWPSILTRVIKSPDVGMLFDLGTILICRNSLVIFGLLEDFDVEVAVGLPSISLKFKLLV